MSKVVLITGCSTGIGSDLAQRLARSGYLVVATARERETLKDLPVACALALDVTQPDSVRQAVEQTLSSFGRIDVLVNNAGYALRGAVEEVPVDDVRAMFEVNVLGVLRMIQAVVPHMRQQQAGRIINISSIAGKFSTPANGTYSATKFALEALSDALRWELAPFGVHVVLVEPAAIQTHFAATSHAYAGSILANPASPYRPLYTQMQRVDASMRRVEPGPEAVSQVVQQAIEAPHPQARYLAAVPWSGRLALHFGDSVWDRAVREMFKLSSRQTAQP